MQFTKTFSAQANFSIAQVTAGSTDNSLLHFNELIAELKKDVPAYVTEQDIKLGIYTTGSHKGDVYAEAWLPKHCRKPEVYTEVCCIE